MSVEIAKKVLSDFLKQRPTAVLALTGNWGVGKTYVWNETLKANKGVAQPDKYCYVSLFGISTLSELRTALFLRAESVKVLQTALTTESVKENWAEFGKKYAKKAVEFFKGPVQGIPYAKNVSVGIEAIAPYFTRDMIVCLDDFERAKISARDILGLVSELKEERGCKVVLIFNADKHDEIDKYREYKEKVVDLEIEYKPTPREAFDLVFPAGFANRDKLFKSIALLEITNVRVLRKIREYSEKVGGLLESRHSQVAEQVAATLTLFCWCAFVREPGKPEVEAIENWNARYFGLTFDLAREQSASDIAWGGRLREYGFGRADELDIALARLVEHGYIDGSGMHKAIESADADARRREASGEFDAAWIQFWGTFTDDPEEFVQRMFRGAESAIETLTSNNLNSTVKLLRDLDEGELADRLIDRFLIQHAAHPEAFDLHEFHFPGVVFDASLETQFEAARRRLAPLPSLGESVAFMAEHSGYNSEHTEAMFAASVDDYEQMFLNPPAGTKLSDLIKWTLKFNSGEFAEIATKAREALVRISRRGRVNAVRGARWGVLPPVVPVAAQEANRGQAADEAAGQD